MIKGYKIISRKLWDQKYRKINWIHNRQISLWIEGAANNIKAELERKKNSINSIKDIEIMEIDELVHIFTFHNNDYRFLGI